MVYLTLHCKGNWGQYATPPRLLLTRRLRVSNKPVGLYRQMHTGMLYLVRMLLPAAGILVNQVVQPTKLHLEVKEKGTDALLCAENASGVLGLIT